MTTIHKGQRIIGHQKTIALLLSSGIGERMGGAIPKQYIQLSDGITIAAHTIHQFISHDKIDFVQIVINEIHEALYINVLNELKRIGTKPELLAKILPHTYGANRRQLSARNGLERMEERGCKYLLIHDIVRPFVKHEIITKILEQLKSYKAVDLGIRIPDLVKRSNTIDFELEDKANACSDNDIISKFGRNSSNKILMTSDETTIPNAITIANEVMISNEVIAHEVISNEMTIPNKMATSDKAAALDKIATLDKSIIPNKTIIPNEDVMPNEAIIPNEIILSKNDIYATQTPQGFDFDTILMLHKKYGHISFDDDISLCIEEGIEYCVVMGNRNNIKITSKEDLEYANFLLGKFT